MTKAHQGLYPIIRRTRRPLVSSEVGTVALRRPLTSGITAPVVAPVKTPELSPQKELTNPQPSTLNHPAAV